MFPTKRDLLAQQMSCFEKSAECEILLFRLQRKFAILGNTRYASATEMPYSAASRTIEFRETSPPETAAELLRAVIDVVQQRLPASWALHTEGSKDGVDAVVRLTAPDGVAIVLLVQAKRLLNTRDVSPALESIRRAAPGRGSDAEVLPVLAARYLAPATRERITESGAGYVDATGNLRLIAERPALFLADRGTDRDPWRGPGRPRGTLQGPPAARVVRALADFAPPYTVPDLARRGGASTGATYRVIEFLEEEDLLTRDRYGPITDVRWRAMLERWSNDYGFARSNTVQTFLEPRGLSTLTERLAASDLGYAVTGSLAAERAAPYAPPRLATVYVRDLAGAAETLGLRRTDTGANVALATGKYDVVFDRTETADGLRVAALTQVAVDLLDGPGRNPSEAIALLDWMEADESRWRR
jgi:hypothetical protein